MAYTVAYIGNYKWPFTTETHIANTLERLGHEVIRIQEHPDLGLNIFNGSDNWDFLMWTRTPDLASQNMWSILDFCQRRQIPTVSYHLDLYIGLKRVEGLDSDPFWRTDYVFQPDGDPASLRIFKEKKINVFWQKPGVDKAECYIAKIPIEHEVIFVGSKGYHGEWPYRPRLIEWLRDTYQERFEHYGVDGKGPIRNDDLNRLYASTKVVVGDSLCLDGHTNYWSDRPYETLGRGGFLIMPRIAGLEKEFKHEEDLIFYDFGDFKELKAQIDHWTNPNEDEHREYIRKHGHKTVKRKYTYDNRIKDMLKILASREGRIKNG